MKTGKEMLNKLLIISKEARRCYLKLSLIDRIITILTTDNTKIDSYKWGKLNLLQKCINNIKNDLGETEADVLFQEVGDVVSDYLNKNSTFKKEALQNLKKLSDIQEERLKALDNILRMDVEE